jgi:hypothetical protein
MAMLLTGLRSHDARSMRWEHLDEDGVLTVPSPKGGADRAFRLPLPRRLLQVLEMVRQETAPLESPFAVFDVASNRQGDHDFFKRLNAQMASGGLAAMLHDLLAIDLGDWRPSRGIPKTKALAEQKALSLDPVSRWWMGLLDRGWLPIQIPYRWEAGAVEIGPNEKFDMMRDLEDFHRSNRLTSHWRFRPMLLTLTPRRQLTKGSQEASLCP